MSDVQAQSQTLDSGILMRMSPVQAFKNMGLVFFTNTNTFVSNRDDHLLGGALYANSDWLAGWAVFDSIVNQVVQYLFQPGLVTGNFYLFLFRFQGDWMSALDFLFLNQAPHQCDNIDIFPVF